MARKYSNRTVKEIKAMMEEDGEFLCPMVRAVIQESLEAESSGHYLFFDKFEKREAGFCREGASPLVDQPTKPRQNLEVGGSGGRRRSERR